MKKEITDQKKKAGTGRGEKMKMEEKWWSKNRALYIESTESSRAWAGIKNESAELWGEGEQEREGGQK